VITGDFARGDVLPVWDLLSMLSNPILAYEADWASLESGLDPGGESSIPCGAACGFSVGVVTISLPRKFPFPDSCRSGIGFDTKGPPMKLLFAEPCRSCVEEPPRKLLLAEPCRSGIVTVFKGDGSTELGFDGGLGPRVSTGLRSVMGDSEVPRPSGSVGRDS
jgi:hypothetical protein